jgi:hypothetical protein
MMVCSVVGLLGVNPIIQRMLFPYNIRSSLGRLLTFSQNGVLSSVKRYTCISTLHRNQNTLLNFRYHVLHEVPIYDAL